MFTEEENLPTYTAVERAATEVIRQQFEEIKSLKHDLREAYLFRDEAVSNAEVFLNDVKAWQKLTLIVVVVSVISVLLPRLF